jgi:hypothetical protein
VALVVAALPIYLYVTPMFNLTFAEHAPLFLVITAVSSIFITIGYEKVARAKMSELILERDLEITPETYAKTKKQEGQQGKMQEKETLIRSSEMEAAAYVQMEGAGFRWMEPAIGRKACGLPLINIASTTLYRASFTRVLAFIRSVA